MKSYANLLKVLVAPIALAAFTAGWIGTSAPVLAKELAKEIEVLIKDREFKMVKGGNPYRPGFSLVRGQETVIKLTNEDKIAHEFVSTVLRDVPVQMSGEATIVSTYRATGFRIDPGKSVTIRFQLPELARYETTYGLFWCNVHGKHRGDVMRGEVLIVEERAEDILPGT